MYQDSYDERGWVRVLRYLSRTFRLGIFFGVEVRVYWLAIVIMPLIGVFEFARVGGPVLQVAVLSLLMTGLLFLLIWTHEMGHILAGRRFGIYTPLITLSPLGGLAHLSRPRRLRPPGHRHLPGRARDPPPLARRVLAPVEDRALGCAVA